MIEKARSYSHKGKMESAFKNKRRRYTLAMQKLEKDTLYLKECYVNFQFIHALLTIKVQSAL